MGAHYTRTGGKPVGGQSYREMAKELQDILWEEYQQAAKEGEAEAKAWIKVAGTGMTWTGPFKGRYGPNRGRIDTGRMLDAVRYSVTKGGANLLVRVGWLGQYEDYFTAQDEGFDAPGFRHAHQEVEGMHMMAHLRFYMRDRIDEATDRALKRVFDGL